jgi:hypothetical protein
MERRKPLARSRIRPRRPEPRRREAPRWTAEQWEQANAQLMARCGGRCECCGEPLTAVERHHRKRRRDGGDRLSNVLMLLPEHHARWTVQPERARELGLIVSVSEEPDEIPLLWRGTSWRLLDDFGLASPIR